ncbi:MULTISPECIES: fimbrial protein [unclassified Caballeronia]|uniref:fimbrial protein n=1 Tax=unclassified Caballeronia TaxID=2646786 RepID=UPI00286707CB|nr:MULTISPECIES: fimbrial protein [unclassified Caballeronia]MDR5812807.1 fimbrial protein [Caballeronia sp. LZ033]MDR5819660.1 fimbrial protein [Caballeronia sp. LZ043]
MNTKRFSFRPAAWLRLIALMAAGIARTASACDQDPSATCYTCWPPQTLTLPSSVSVAADLAPGTLLTQWVTSGLVEFDCRPKNSTVGIGMYLRGDATTRTGVLVFYNGANIPVLATGVPGVGIAIAMQFESADGSRTAWQGVQRGGPMNYDAWSPMLAGQSGSKTVGAQTAIALVKTGPLMSSAWLRGNRIMLLQPYVDAVVPPTVDISTTSSMFIPMTCTTPDQSVDVGTFMASDFPAVGSLSPPQPGKGMLNVQFLNCPGGSDDPGTVTGLIHAVSYTISPQYGEAAHNVAALQPNAGSAGGIGVQLFDSAGKVVRLNTSQRLYGYSSLFGGSYQVPLTARFYRTGPVTPGNASTIMTMTVLYQ